MGDRQLWERCWSDSDATPTYYESNVVREDGGLWYVPEGYEYSKSTALRDTLRASYPGPVYEFGCGNGHNLRPGDKGFDWSEAAVAKVLERGLEAELFDMFDPKGMKIPGIAMTFHAMEQLGKNFQPFFDFLKAAKPAVVIHVEPLLELYGESLLDYLAILYHKKRHYLDGYVPAILASGVEVVHLQRTYFGNLYHEAYSLMVWKP